MAESSWPQPNADPALDRVVTDTQYEQLAVTAGPTAGLYSDTGLTALIYGDSSGRQFKIRAGRYGSVRGFAWTSGPAGADATFAVPANASGSTRIDLVVLRLDRSAWTVRIALVAGTPGSGVAPAPTQTEAPTGVWELPLAAVTVTNGAATLTAGNVVFMGVHLRSDGGGYKVATVAGLAYVPVVSGWVGPKALVAADKTDYLYDGSIWAASGLWRARQILLAPAASITFSGIPANLRTLQVIWSCRSNDAGFQAQENYMKINGSATAADYDTQYTQSANATTPTSGNNFGTVGAHYIGLLSTGGALSGMFGSGQVTFQGWDSPHAGFLGHTFSSQLNIAAAGSQWLVSGGGNFRPSGPYISLTFYPKTSSYIAGTDIQLVGTPS